MSGHGLLTYNVNLLFILDRINEEYSVVRLTLEDTKASDKDIDTFTYFCAMCELRYENITFVGGYHKGTWNRLYFFNNGYNIRECYWTFSKKRWFPFPKFYAWLNNKGFKRVGYDGYLMLDFIQL